METSIVKEIIKWAIENAFNIETKEGTHYIAIDYEEMRKKFDEWMEQQLRIPPVIESAFCEVFDKAACIHHWHDTLYNKETGECEGMVVSASHVRELWEVLSKYRDFRHSL